ncbi:MAG: ATP phosphoribosyltransferase regulatory subunit [Nitrospira sp.]|nr:ATP phosphoribosyltransferase regulatory subunit [Nitrospira sp.]
MTRFTKKSSSLLPKGMAVLLPEAAARQRAIERTALAVFKLWGYREVIPPLFEYLDILSKTLEPELVEKSYKFVDRSNGRVMILRPDVTPQIARMVALLMADQPKPIRLCYSANVFRYEQEHAGREREILQIGGELVGPQDAESDAEIIALVVEILKQLGLSHFRIAIGQIGFFKALLQEMGVPEPEHLQVQKALAGRDAARLNQILEGLGLQRREVHKIVGLLELFGQEEVFDRARQLVQFSPVSSCLSALARLEEVYALLKRYGLKDQILIDLSEVRGFGYYSGMVFEVFTEGVGYELGGGGRYDHLISHFGVDIPSTGFALHVERLQRALEHMARVARPDYDMGVDVLVMDAGEVSEVGIRLSQALRQRGLSVIRRVMAPEQVSECLEQCRSLKVAHAIVLEPITTHKKNKAVKQTKDLYGIQAIWINSRTGTKKRLKLQQFLRLADKLLNGRRFV